MDHTSASTPKASAIPTMSKLPVMRGTISKGQTAESIQQDSSGKIVYLKHRHAPSLVPDSGLLSNQATISLDTDRNRILATDKDSSKELNVDEGVMSKSVPRRKPRPSLSDRAIETLSQIPPTPSPRRGKSSFFPSESPIMSPARPPSSMNRSRPTTSHGQYPLPRTGIPDMRPPSPTKRQLPPASLDNTPQKASSKGAVNSPASRNLAHPPIKPYGTLGSTPSKLKPLASIPGGQHGTNYSTIKKPALTQIRGSKTMTARPFTQRQSVMEAFEKPAPPVSKPGTGGRRRISTASSASSGRTVLTSEANGRARTAVEPPAFLALEKSTPPKSSAALRETIAKAKAARRDAMKPQGKASSKVQSRVNDLPNFEVGSNEEGLGTRIAKARSDGRLHIAAMGLKEMPTQVLNMYNSDAHDTTDGAWYESVDLVRVIAADNEIEHLDDRFFPDPSAYIENSEGNIFGGLETLDLHGNLLPSLPQGLSSLTRLITLNVSKNRLSDESVNVLGKIHSLRELRVADNNLKEGLDSLCRMPALEILDLSNNAFTDLPSDINELRALHTLLVSGNEIRTVPLAVFECMSLRELNMSQNRLSGALFPHNLGGLVAIKSLDVSYNALATITDRNEFAMPSLQTFNISENRIKDLPDLSSWEELITLTAGGNRIAAIPNGLTSLTKLRNVDLTRNDIKKFDERLGVMDSLTALRIANNPLRERKFLTMATDDLKRELRSRLLPADSLPGGEQFDSGLITNSNTRSSAELWPVQPGGILDRSSTNLQTINPSDLEPILETTDIKTMLLHHNHLSSIPRAIALLSANLTTLDLSHNKFSPTYLTEAEPLSLPQLKSLDLTANALKTLSPLINYLSSPSLTDLTLNRNRLTTLPPLHSTFPALTTVFAADNLISDLPVEAVRGLQVLDASGNDIAHLEPKLGLLGKAGLRTLVVTGNRFRVPRREVVEKGTEAVLRWLRGRIADGEGEVEEE